MFIVLVTVIYIFIGHMLQPGVPEAVGWVTHKIVTPEKQPNLV